MNQQSIHQTYTAKRRFHRSPRKLMKVLREHTAEPLTQAREAFRNQRRQARADAKVATPNGIPDELLIEDLAWQRQRTADQLEKYRPDQGVNDLLPPTHPRGQHRMTGDPS